MNSSMVKFEHVVAEYEALGYTFSDNKQTLQVKTAQTINLDELKEVLLSTDASLLTKYGWIFDGKSKFLDAKDSEPGRITFTTCPRTGNSFLRMYMENITGVTTGNDMPSNLTLFI